MLGDRVVHNVAQITTTAVAVQVLLLPPGKTLNAIRRVCLCVTTARPGVSRVPEEATVAILTNPHQTAQTFNVPKTWANKRTTTKRLPSE